MNRIERVMDRMLAQGFRAGLPATELQLVRPQHDREHSEPPRRRLEGDARARRRLLEDHPERDVLEELRACAVAVRLLEHLGHVEELDLPP